MKKVTLDIKKWGVGLIPGNGVYHMGNGPAQLLNFGRMQTFIGQFCSQLGIDDELLFLVYTPDKIEVEFYRMLLTPIILQSFNHQCTDFTNDCDNIEDCRDLNIEQKLLALAILCYDKGYELEVLHEELIPEEGRL